MNVNKAPGRRGSEGEGAGSNCLSNPSIELISNDVLSLPFVSINVSLADRGDALSESFCLIYRLVPRFLAQIILVTEL